MHKKAWLLRKLSMQILGALSSRVDDLFSTYLAPFRTLYIHRTTTPTKQEALESIHCKINVQREVKVLLLTALAKGSIVYPKGMLIKMGVSLRSYQRVLAMLETTAHEFRQTPKLKVDVCIDNHEGHAMDVQEKITHQLPYCTHYEP